MSELREKDLRWQIAFEITTGDLDGKSSGEIADNILALLPSPAINDELDRLRGKIERQDEELQHYKHHLERAHSHHAKLAAQLLSASSPAMSGVEAMGKCTACNGVNPQMINGEPRYCLVCVGTGELTRELTEHEASEELKYKIAAHEKFDLNTYSNTGETLRLKKEK